MDEVNKETGNQDQAADQSDQAAASVPTLEEFLANPERKGAYDAAVNAAVEQALAEHKATEEEAARVAALSEEEKANERERALAEREAKLQAAEYKSEAVTKLAAAGISTGLAECLNYSSKEAYEQSYAAATAAYQAAVQAGINDRLRGKNLPVDQPGDSGRATKSGGFAAIINENRARR